MADNEQRYPAYDRTTVSPVQHTQQPIEVLGASNTPYTPSADNPYLNNDDLGTQTALQNLVKSRTKKRRKKRIKIILACAVVGAVLAVLVGKFLLPKEEVVPEPVLETYVVARMDYSDDVSASGTLKAGSTVTVTPEVDGVIESVKVVEGQEVKEGDVLLTIKNDDLDKAVRDAERDVTTAQQDVTTAENEVTRAQAAKDDAWKRYREEWDRANDEHGEWEYLNDNYADLHSEWQERKELADALACGRPTEPTAPSNPGSGASQEQKDKYNAALNEYQDKYAQYLSDLDAYQAYQDALSRVGDEPQPAGTEPRYPDEPDDVSLDAAITNAQTSLTNANNALTKAKEAYDDAVKAGEKRTVKAPSDGSVVALNAKVGASVGGSGSDSSSNPLVQISDISKMSVDVEVNEIDILAIKKGQKAKVTFSAVPDVEVAALVKEVSTVASGSGDGGGIVTFHVGLTVPYPDEKLRPGMSANVKINTVDVKNALVVPTSAITEGSAGATVEVVLDEETMITETRRVTLGARGQMQVVIEDGISEGEVLLLNASTDDAEYGG